MLVGEPMIRNSTRSPTIEYLVSIYFTQALCFRSLRVIWCQARGMSVRVEGVEGGREKTGKASVWLQVPLNSMHRIEDARNGRTMKW